MKCEKCGAEATKIVSGNRFSSRGEYYHEFCGECFREWESAVMTGKYSVWVGGGEWNSHYLTFEQAQDLAIALMFKGGYDDVQIEEVE